MPLAAGDKLGPYEILAPIGAGGMGEVYRARDPRLNRDVAVKVTAGKFSERFEREAQAIAALNHPYICQVYDVGPNYLVMEFIEGSPLRGPLAADQAIRYAAQICGALEAAHAKKIIHRDLKPANILLTAAGVKLLDFGLAKMAPRDLPPDVTQTMGLTEAGMVMGTAAYMSPEQARGETVDARSDIFSFGVVLYEMLSGRLAFERNSSIETLSAILRDEPAPIDAPSNLVAIVHRCLSKLPGDRFQTITDVRMALEQAASGAVARQYSERHVTERQPAEKLPSIAVLPFANIGADKENEYFSEGLAEEILNALSQVEGLRVAARTSSFSFKGSGAELSEIAAKLRVAHVLEGSVRRAGNKVRVTVQLVDTANGFHLWSERYDRQMEDIFDVQDEIARAIADRLKVTLRGGVQRGTHNLEAYELYLKGRHYWHQRSPSTLRVAMQCFEQAIKVDPDYALAWAGLADCYSVLRVYGLISAEDARPRASAAVQHAVTLAPELWEVNFSRGVYTFYFERDWRQAEPHFQKAIAINPGSSLAQVYYGVFLGMARRGEEAAARVRLACQLDPLSAFAHALAGGVLELAGLPDAAEKMARQALELQPDYLFGLWLFGFVLTDQGRSEAAITPLERAVTLSRAPVFLANLGLAYGRTGQTDAATRLLRELEERSSRGEYIPSFAPLSIYVGLGDVPAIRLTLAKTLAEATPPLSVIVISGCLLEAFRSDPEIDRMLFELYGW